MKKISSVFLMLSLIMSGCGSSSVDEAKKQDDSNITKPTHDNEVTSSEKKEETKADNNEVTSSQKKEETKTDNNKVSSKDTSKKDSSTKSSSNSSSKKTDDTANSSTTKPRESSSNNNSSSTPPKEEPKIPEESVKKWAMSEAEMIEYAKKCVVKYKPTSGYGKCQWAEEFNKKNSGWYEATTLKISKTKNQLQELIKITVNSTLEKSTSQVLDDGKGNVDKEAIYGTKGYLEKVNDEQYKFYVFY